MYCVRSSEELTSFMDGELSPARAAEIQRHLAACAACRRELSRLKQTAGLVGALAEVAPPADLRARAERKVAQPRPVTALTCVGVREMLDEYAHGELAGGTAESVQAHLSECAACSRELARLEQGAGLLRTLADVNPPARIRQRMQREVARRSRPMYARPGFRGMVATLGTAAAAAALMIALRTPTPMQPPVSATAPAKPASGPAVAASPTTPSAPSPAGKIIAEARDTVNATARLIVGRGKGVAAGQRRVVALEAVADRASEPTAAAADTRGSSSAQPPAMTAAYPDTGTVLADAAGAVRGSLDAAAPTPALAQAGPVVEPEPAVPSEALPRPHPTRDATLASAAPTVASPLSEVRRALRSEPNPDPPIFSRKRQPDRFAAGPIPAWGF